MNYAAVTPMVGGIHSQQQIGQAMALDEATRSRIESYVASDNVVLFMKGTRQFPQCGFSAATTGILDRLVPEYTTVNVLEDESIRQGIKEFADWPTIPQLYVRGEFVGGCDLVQEMFDSGELHRKLGVTIPDPEIPAIRVSDEAAGLIREAMRSHPDQALVMSVDARGNAQMQLGPAPGSAVRVESNGLALHLDPLSASRADGLAVELADTPQGQGLRVFRPEAD